MIKILTYASSVCTAVIFLFAFFTPIYAQEIIQDKCSGDNNLTCPRTWGTLNCSLESYTARCENSAPPGQSCACIVGNDKRWGGCEIIIDKSSLGGKFTLNDKEIRQSGNSEIWNTVAADTKDTTVTLETDKNVSYKTQTCGSKTGTCSEPSAWTPGKSIKIACSAFSQPQRVFIFFRETETPATTSEFGCKETNTCKGRYGTLNCSQFSSSVCYNADPNLDCFCADSSNKNRNRINPVCMISVNKTNDIGGVAYVDNDQFDPAYPAYAKAGESRTVSLKNISNTDAGKTKYTVYTCPTKDFNSNHCTATTFSYGIQTRVSCATVENRPQPQYIHVRFEKSEIAQGQCAAETPGQCTKELEDGCFTNYHDPQGNGYICTDTGFSSTHQCCSNLVNTCDSSKDTYRFAYECSEKNKLPNGTACRSGTLAGKAEVCSNNKWTYTDYCIPTGTDKDTTCPAPGSSPGGGGSSTPPTSAPPAGSASPSPIASPSPAPVEDGCFTKLTVENACTAQNERVLKAQWNLEGGGCNVYLRDYTAQEDIQISQSEEECTGSFEQRFADRANHDISLLASSIECGENFPPKDKEYETIRACTTTPPAGGTPPPSSSCTIGSQSPNIGDNCASCIEQNRSGLTSSIKRLNPSTFNSCSQTQLINYWCNGGISNQAGEECNDTKNNRCASVCGGTVQPTSPPAPSIPAPTAVPTAIPSPTPTVIPTPTPQPPGNTLKAETFKATCTNNALRFDWAPIVGGARYELRIDDILTAWQPAPMLGGDTREDALTQPFYTRTGETGHTYNWWVQAVKTDGTRSDVVHGQAVQCWPFDVPGFTPVPTNIQTTCPDAQSPPTNLTASNAFCDTNKQKYMLQLSWNQVPNAQWYDLRVQDQSNPTTKTIESVSGFANNCGTVPHDICINTLKTNTMAVYATPGKTYRMWVHAGGQSNGQLCSATILSPSITFTIPANACPPTVTPSVTPPPGGVPTPTPFVLNDTNIGKYALKNKTCLALDDLTEITKVMQQIAQGQTVDQRNSPANINGDTAVDILDARLMIDLLGNPANTAMLCANKK